MTKIRTTMKPILASDWLNRCYTQEHWCIGSGIVQTACQAAANENSQPVKSTLWKNNGLVH